MKYRSMAETIHDIVDCRELSLELNFFRVDKPWARELTKYLVGLCREIYAEGFFDQWSTSPHKKVDHEKLLKIINDPPICLDLICEADVISSHVWNKRSFKAYDRFLYGPEYDFLTERIGRPFDYMEYFCSCKEGLLNPCTSKETLLKMFYEPQKYMKALWRAHDSDVLLICEPYGDNRDLYHGSLKFSVALECLENANEFADRLKTAVIRATNITSNINAHIYLSPLRETSHKLYLGSKLKIDGSHKNNCSEDGIFVEWYPFYYLSGAEWFNLLSPLVANRVKRTTVVNKDIEIIELPKNSIVVQSNKEIKNFDVADMVGIKKLLYPVLLPGSSKLSFDGFREDFYNYRRRPRFQWECFPVFEEEISVGSDGITLSYNEKVIDLC